MTTAGELMFDDETLDVEEFLCDVALHLRRRDIRTLLSYLGMPAREIDELLTENIRLRHGSERGMLTSSGLVVDGSSAINFLQQRKQAIRAWWAYAAHTNLRTTPAQQNMKIVESRSTTLPGIREEKDGIKVSQMKKENSNITNFLGSEEMRQSLGEGPQIKFSREPSHDPLENEELDVMQEIKFPTGISMTTPSSKQAQSLLPPVIHEIPGSPPARGDDHPPTDGQFSTASGPLPSVASVPFVQIQTVNSQALSESLIDLNSTRSKKLRWDPSGEFGNEENGNEVTVHEAGVSLEELLRKLWRCLQSCGLTRVVDELQQRWMIRVNTKQGRSLVIGPNFTEQRS